MDNQPITPGNPPADGSESTNPSNQPTTASPSPSLSPLNTPPANQPPVVSQPIVSPVDPASIVVGDHTQPAQTAGTPSVPVPKASKRKKLLAPLIIISILVIAVGVYALFFQKTSYLTVANEFVTAMGDHDKAKADSLMSSNGKSVLQKAEGTSSFYSLCQKEGELCTYYFAPKFINSTKITSKNYYSSTYHDEVKEVLYEADIKQSEPGGKGCSVNNTSSVAVYLVPNGNSWLVDGANPTTDFSANLCFSGSTSSNSN